MNQNQSPLKCEECNADFVPRTKRSRFCSTKCRERNKARAYREANRTRINQAKRDAYRKSHPQGSKVKTLADFPAVLNTWDYERNDSSLRPEELWRGSDDQFGPEFEGFWWRCDVGGHSYPMKIRGRLKGSKCLVCAGKPVPGVNDLFSTFPELRAFWDSENNLGDPPQNIRIGERGTEYWWRCPEGHGGFQMDARRAKYRADNNLSLCDLCSQRQKLAGSSVAEKMPELAEEWSSANQLGPDYYSVGSNQRVLWTCPLGHGDWEASPYERKIGARLCPCCPGSHRLVEGCNDLATTHPTIARRWDSTRNQKTPQEVKIGSNIKAYFICEANPNHHPRMYLPNLRFNEDACTDCWKTPIICGENDLACTAPDLIKDWDWDRNKTEHPEVDPHKIRATDERVFFWNCPNGEEHSYPRSAYSKWRGNSGCTVCASRVIIPGQNSLKALFPEIAAQWLEENNTHLLPLTPDTAPPSGGAVVNWICEAGKGHPTFASTIWNRTAAETGCPACNEFGYKKHLPGLLYLVERGDSPEYRAGRKIGITNVRSAKTRLKHWEYLGFAVVFKISDEDGEVIANLEKRVLKDWLRSELGIPIWYTKEEMKGGETETIGPLEPTNEEIVAQISEQYRALTTARAT